VRFPTPARRTLLAAALALAGPVVGFVLLRPSIELRSRRPPIAPVEVAHRSCSACLLHHIAMKTRRTLHWDPIKERVRNDDEANAMLSRPQRWPYMIG
jgi:hypothetical protein